MRAPAETSTASCTLPSPALMSFLHQNSVSRRASLAAMRGQYVFTWAFQCLNPCS